MSEPSVKNTSGLVWASRIGRYCDEGTGDLHSQLAATPESTRRARFRRWIGWGLICYWIGLFISTHIPLPEGTLPGGSDKLAHFGAYALLSAWLMFWCSLRSDIAARHALAAWGIMAAYALLDEGLQKPTGRTPDVWDCAADWGGAAAGAIAVIGLRGLIVRLNRNAN